MDVIVTFLSVAFAASLALNWRFFRRQRPEKSVRSTILQSIQNVKELTTVRQYFQSVVSYKDTKTVYGVYVPGTERRFLLRYSGVLTCGSDLEKIQISERFAVNHVRIVVPRSKVLDIYPDMKSVEVYDQKAGIFTSLTLNEQNREIADDLEKMRHGVMQHDTLRRADENTRALLTSLLASLDMEAEIIFDDPTTTPQPVMTEAVAPALKATQGRRTKKRRVYCISKRKVL